MKKSIFIFAALFAATCANAQITLDTTLTGLLLPACDLADGNMCLPDENIIYNQESVNQSTINIYDASTYHLESTLHCPVDLHILFFAKNLFTANDTYAMICYGSDTIGGWYYRIYDELGQTVLLDMGYINLYKKSPYTIFKTPTGYKLASYGANEAGDNYVTRIYALPGIRSTVDINEVSIPRNNNGRKYLRNDQVLIDANSHTYTITGQQVR